LEQQPGDYEESRPFDRDDFDGLKRVEEILTGAIERSRSELKLPLQDAPWYEAAVCHLLHCIVFACFEEAWQRQLSYLPFPIEVRAENEDVRLYLRHSSGEWKEETNEHTRRLILGEVEELRDKHWG
jgi:hypothetical protein